MLYTKVLNITFLTLFYISSVKKINYFFIGVLVCYAIAEVNFKLRNGLIAMCFVAISRSFLLFIVVNKFKIKNRKFFYESLVVFSLVCWIILFLKLNHSNTRLYILIILVALLLTILFTILFLKLINTRKHGVLEMFLGVSIFIFSDTLFAFNSSIFSGKLEPIIVAFTYHLAFFFLTISMIKKALSN